MSKETFGAVLRAELISGVSSFYLCDPSGESPAGHPPVLLATLSTQPQGPRRHLWAQHTGMQPISEARAVSQLALEPTGEGGWPSRSAADRHLWAWTEARPRALGANWRFFVSASLDDAWLVLST